MPLYVTSTIKPTGKFPTFEDVDGYGGFQVRSDTTDRDSIPAQNRKRGMLVYVISDNQFYQLDVNLTSWSVVSFSNASQLQGRSISTVAPATGQVLMWNGTSSTWSPTTLPSPVLASNTDIGIVQLTNDFGGTATSPKVTGIQGVSVDSAVPTDGHVMLYTSSKWRPTQFLDTSVTPLDGYILSYSSGKWKPQRLSTISSNDATSSANGIIRLAGDLNAGSASSPQVTGLLGKQIDSTVTLADGYVMLYNSATNQWKPQPQPVNPNSTVKLNSYVSVDPGNSTVDYYFTNDSSTFARWAFDEATSSASFSNSVTSTPLTLTKYGSVNSFPGSSGGLSGNFLSFNGTDGYLSTANTSTVPSNTKAITISVWVKIPDLAAGSNPNFATILQRAFDATASQISFRINKYLTDGSWSGALYITPSSSSSPSAYSFTIEEPQFKIKQNEWTLLSVTYDGYYIKAYTNGQLASQYGISGSLNYGTGSYNIGGRAGSTTASFYSGYIDDVRIDSSVRSQAYLLDMYTKIINKFHTLENSHIGGSLAIDGPVVSRLTTKQDCLLPTDEYTFINWNFDAPEGTSSFSNSGTESSVNALYKKNDFYHYNVNNLSQQRYSHTSTLLMDGRVLIAGGAYGVTGGGAAYLSSCEIYDPSNPTTTSVINMSVARVAHTATLLKNGKVLIVGGYSAPGASQLTSCEIYDPGTNTFYPCANTNVARATHTATLLNDGRVLIVGGWLGSSATNTAELYDPATDTFKLISAMPNYFTNGHTATLLNTGDVLIAGGYGTGGSYTTNNSLNYAVLYKYANLSDGSFSPTANQMKSQRHYHTSSLLSDGTVLLIGGLIAGTGAVNTTEIYDPSSNSFTTSSTPSLSVARYLHTATTLKNGDVFVLGGCTDSSAAATTTASEIYGISNGSFSVLSTSQLSRGRHAASLLYDGRIFLSGGHINDASVPSNTLKTYSTQSINKMHSTQASDLNSGCLFSDGFYGGYLLSAPPSGAPNPNKKDITVSCWVKLIGYGESSKRISLVHKKYSTGTSWDDTSNSSSLEISVNSDGTWRARILTGASTRVSRILPVSATNYTVPLNKWTLLSFTYSASGLFTAYFNGVQAATMSITSDNDINYGTGEYCIGSHINTSIMQNLNGFIADVRIENATRSAFYLQSMYNSYLNLVGAKEKQLISESNSASSVNQIKSRAYNENDGSQTFVQNAMWNATSKKWEQENKQIPSSTVYSKPMVSDGGSEKFKYLNVGIKYKEPNSSSWTDWDTCDFTINNGTSVLSDKKDQIARFTNVFIGPYSGPGYSQLILRGNTYRGNYEHKTGGPRIIIDKSYPRSDQTGANSLYSTNIPKALASFKFNNSGVSALGNGGNATLYGANALKTYIYTCFNVRQITCTAESYASGYYSVFFQNPIYSILASVSIDGSSGVPSSDPYFAKCKRVSDNQVMVYLIDGSGTRVAPDTVTAPINLLVFGVQ